MHDRQFPRLCSSCNGPMARQEISCWRCGTLQAMGYAPAAAASLQWRPAELHALARAVADMGATMRR